MSIRHLRCEPGKGLVAVYNAYPARSGSARSPAAGTRARPVTLSSVKGWAWSSSRLLTLTLGDQVLDGPRIRFDSEAIERAPIELEAPGIVRARDLALAIQGFPADTSLPALPDCFDTSEGGPVFASLELAARTLLGDSAWRKVAVRAEALRYKPASRCVILYELALEHPRLAGGASEGWSPLVVCGKAYADREHARAVSAVQESLHRESQRTMDQKVAGHTFRAPLVPRPLGRVDDLALLLSEMVRESSSPNRVDAPAAEDSWKPRIVRRPGGMVVDLNTPTTKIRCAAATMARLHTSSISTFAVPPRTSAGDVKQVRERASRIAEANPAEADSVLALSRRVAESLEAAEPGVLMPGHGSFKPTEMLFRDGDAVVIDLDKIGLADPAGDVGCFLAYLRPTSLWYQRSGLHQWFDRAADDFVSSYRRAMLDLGVASPVVDGILERARAYEAAKLFRIAVRHVTRNNSPRPRELSAICGDIAECLDGRARWSKASQS
jgi:hypothetical protein